MQLILRASRLMPLPYGIVATLNILYVSVANFLEG